MLIEYNSCYITLLYVLLLYYIVVIFCVFWEPIKFAYKNKLTKFIKTHKDIVPKKEHKNVVYCIECDSYYANYVGQTKRQLNTRIRECLNNVKKGHEETFVLAAHSINTRYNFKWDSIKIVDNEHNYYKRLTSEMLKYKTTK